MSSVVSTSFCAWCGALTPRNAGPWFCPCDLVSYCGKNCQAAGWPSHRLVCPYNKRPSKAHTKLLLGDYVLIDGLQSQTGRAMNGLLGEVQAFDEGKQRYQVMFSTRDPYKVKTVLIKRDNLTLKLSASGAVVRSNKMEKKLRALMTRERENEHEVETQAIHLSLRNNRGWISLDGSSFVQRIKYGDNSTVEALLRASSSKSPPPPVDEVIDILDNGLVGACLEKFVFPLAVDGDPAIPVDENDIPPHTAAPVMRVKVLSVLLLLLNGNTGRKYRLQVVQKLAPLIHLVSTKKRRLFGATEYWWSLQDAFLALLQSCCLSEEILTKIHSLPEEVVKTLMEYLVFVVSCDTRVFLHPDSPCFVEEHWLVNSKIVYQAIAVIARLVNVEEVGNHRVSKFGMVSVPREVKGIVGRTFASCYLDIAARTLLSKFDFVAFNHGELVKNLRSIYKSFMKSSDLKRRMGDVDVVFLDHVNSQSESHSWATRKMSTSALA